MCSKCKMSLSMWLNTIVEGHGVDIQINPPETFIDLHSSCKAMILVPPTIRSTTICGFHKSVSCSDVCKQKEGKHMHK